MFRFVICVLSSFLFLSSVAEALPFVKEIKVSGNHRVETDTVLSYMPLRIGDSFNQDHIDQSLKDLFKTGYFQDVRIEVKGTTVWVYVQENPLINQISFEGNDKLKEEIIRQEIRLNPREVLVSSRVQDCQQRLLEIYRRMGRHQAKVDVKLIKLPENRVDLVFEIDEGVATYIRKIYFIGNRKFSDKRLQEQLQSKESRWYRFFSNDDYYDVDRFVADQQALRKFYFDNGYPDFRVMSAVAELSSDKKDFYLTFTIEEGVLYKFGKIDIQSSLPNVKSDELKRHVTFEEGDLFNGSLVEKTVTQLTDIVGSLGYAFVSVEPRIEKNEKEAIARVVFEVREGPKAYIEKIMITGNDTTRHNVIMREMSLHELDPFNASKIKQSENNLKDLGYFKNVQVETEEGSAFDRAVLSIKAEEQSTGELGLAGGYSTVDGPLADIRVSQRNFRGTGQTVYSGLTVAKKRLDFDVGIVEPYFLGRRLAASADAFHVRSNRIKAFEHLMTGANIGLGYRLSEHWGQSWTYSLRREKVAKIDAFSSPFLRAQSGSFYISSLTHGIAYDRRNSRAHPTGGYILTMSNGFAGLGGNVSFLRNELGAAWYYSVMEDVVFGLKGNIGALKKIRHTIRVVDRFLLGADSLRGFEYGGVSPRDLITKDPLGGFKYWTASAETMFPIGLPNEFGVKGALFFDAGSAWDSGFRGPTIGDTSYTRMSVGFGIAWTSPFGPLRIDFAVPLRRQKFDQTQRILFGMSTRF